MYSEWQALGYTARGQLGASGDGDLDTARVILEGLVKDYPEIPAYPGHLGRTYEALARLAADGGDTRGASEWLTKASRSLRSALVRTPENADDRRSLDSVEAALKRAGGNPGAGGGDRPPPGS
jgi:hypothetical protein